MQGILDFGLATAVEGSSVPPISATHPAMTWPDDDDSVAVILGTRRCVHEPEQAQRTSGSTSGADIWSFGCVLFEMLTRKRAFEAETGSATIAAVMTREPDWNALPPDVPSALRTLLGRCLEKDRKHRLAHIADARPEIVEATAPSRARAALERRPARRRELLAWCVAAVSVTALGAGVMYVTTTRRTPAEVRFTLSVPESVELDPEDCAVSGRQKPCLRCTGSGAHRFAVGATSRRIGRQAARGNRRCILAVLVARQPVDRVLRGRQVEAHSCERRHRADAGRGAWRPQIGGTGGTWNSNDSSSCSRKVSDRFRPCRLVRRRRQASHRAAQSQEGVRSLQPGLSRGRRASGLRRWCIS